jgi:hypothetical protein
MAMAAADLRGIARLATEATLGVTDVVEAVHSRIARVPALPALPALAALGALKAVTGVGTRDAAAARDRTRGITRLVYAGVRGVTRTVGGGVDMLLGLATPGPATDAEPALRREALVAALNGVLGDHLAATGNPLATPMGLRRDGRALALDAATLAARVPDAGPTLLLAIHGLCRNDLQWRRADGSDPVAELAATLGFTPLHLHYNSGLPVAANGRALAELLEALAGAWPRPLKRIVLLGHSMGGLLARSALHQGRQAGHHWPARVSDLVCIATPHLGAPLERAGHGVDTLLGVLPIAAPLARLGRVRSAGITDLRHGRVLADGAEGDEGVEGTGDPTPRDSAHRPGRRHPRHLPLPEGVRCFAVGATLGPRHDSLKSRLLGDGLVPLDSALGRHADAARTLSFAPDRQWIGHGIGHLELPTHPAVQAQLLQWLGAAPGRRGRLRQG